MSIFSSKKKNLHDYLYPLIIIVFSFFINWNYSKFGVFPVDTFLHYDSAYKILNGEYPVRDYWVVSGIFVDFLQAIFFKLLGVNWHAYIAHSSLLNLILSISTFYFLIKLKLKKRSAFFYAISFSILAYTISGTPFLDLHATFFSLIAFYLIILALENPEKKLNWFLIVLFFYISFLSKQVPASYLILINIIIIFPYLLNNKFYKSIIVVLFSIIFFFLLTLLIFKIINVDFNHFYIQYFDYPRSIGLERFNIFNISLEFMFNKFKFILIPIFILSLIKLKKLLAGKIKFYSLEFTIFLIFFFFCACLIFHQQLTKNQIYIYFLIPLTFAFLHIEIEKFKFELKPISIYLIILLVSITTIKYHLRFNETRKFHELEKTDISKYVDSRLLHKSLNGHFWVSPSYIGNPKDELKTLMKVRKKINQKKKNIMLVTHYLFLDSITNKKINAPSRSHTLEGDSIPIYKNKYFKFYKNYFKNKIIKEQIEEVYFIKMEENISTEIFTNLIKKKCYSKFEDDIFTFFTVEIKCLN